MTKFPVEQPTAKSVCVCGHEGDGAGSSHAPASGPVAGHGPCMAGGCKCERFRWSSWVPGFEPQPKEYADKVAHLKDGWAVRFEGKIEGARWMEKGPAMAHLQLLQNGARKPQPETVTFKDVIAAVRSANRS